MLGVTKVQALNERLIICRNPWGRDSYYGRYGAFSEEARDHRVTNEIPEIENPDDGVIYVPLNQFKKSFGDINVNFNADGMKFDYYLKTNDET